MKKIVLIGVVALTAASALARGRVADDPKKVLERYRDSVLSEIRTEAYRQATTETEEKFGIVYVNWSDKAGETEWTNKSERPILFQTYRTLCKYDKDGRLVKAGKVADFEECRWREARQKEIQEALWQDLNVVGTVVSNVFAKEEVRAREFRYSKQSSQSRVGSLEELIPLEEALSLAKEGKGKGYFQLALRYTNGLDLPRESRMAYKMLRKAADANYANAILVEGLLDEEYLETPSVWPDRQSRWNEQNQSVCKALREYCGTDVYFDTSRHSKEADSLTNEVSFARVMRKYEKAKERGALTATNQIAALNKRLSDFNGKKAEEEKKRTQQCLEYDKRSTIWTANNRKVNAVLGAKELARYRAAFKGMFGYEMGETIAQEAGDSTEVDSNGKSWRVRKLRTPYRNFTSMHLGSVGDRLWELEIEREAEDKSASDSLEQEAIAIAKDLEQRYDIKFWQNRYRDCCRWGGGRYGWQFMITVNKGRMSVNVQDYELQAVFKVEEMNRHGLTSDSKNGGNK